MGLKLRILHIEDQPADSEIVQEKLRREGFDPEIHRVETLDEFTRALRHGAYSLIISDYALPAMDALDALRLARQQCPEIPFIFLSGVLGEEQAIDCLKLGATDYVLKQRLARLVPAIRRALQERQEHTEREKAEAARRASEEKLRASEERLRKAISTPTVGVLFFTLDGRILEANATFQRMSGYSAEELCSLHWKTLTASEDWDTTVRAAGELANRGETSPYEKTMVRKDGSRWWGLFAPVRLAGSGASSECMEFIVDLTEQKRAEAALQRHTFHLHLLHQAAARLLVGQPPVDLLRQLHPEIAQAFGAEVFMLYQASPGNGHLHLQACAGVTEQERRKIEALRYGRAICAKPTEALQPIIATHILTREAPNRRFVRKLGFRSYLYYPLIFNHRLHGTVAFASRSRDDYDRTDLDFFHTVAGTLAEAIERERLESELQSRAADLERTVQERTARLQETIAELEQMSYSMIHDLRAPLRAIRSFGDIIAGDSENRLTEESREMLRKMIAATGRMDHLVRDVLNYSRVVREELPLEPVDVSALVRGIMETYPDLRYSRAEVRVAPGLPAVIGNAAALTQCLSQLLGNAVKFAKPGRAPSIQIKGEPGDHGFVRIVVEDNGVGIAPEIQRKIFGMFQQMRNTGEGTGMGLAIVRKAVERMGGRVGVESQPGQGSRFWIELKAAAEPVHDLTKALSE